MQKIIPAILPKTKNDLTQGLKKIKSFAKWVQIDIADGRLVGNQTLTLEFLEKYFSEKLKDFFVEFHLMVDNPFEKLKVLKKITPCRVYLHFEAIKNISEIKEKIRIFDFEIGLAINPETKINQIKNIIDDFDYFLFMTVNPGFQGQKFLPEVIEKIRQFKQIFPLKKISVDGGVNDQTIKIVKTINPDFVVAGSFILKNQDPEKAYRKLAQNL